MLTGAAMTERPLPLSGTDSAVPAELLRLPGGDLQDADVDQGGAAEVRRLVEDAAILWVFDHEALATRRVYHLVVARAVDQRIRLQVKNGVVRDLSHTRADVALVEDDDLAGKPQRTSVSISMLEKPVGESPERRMIASSEIELRILQEDDIGWVRCQAARGTVRQQMGVGHHPLAHRSPYTQIYPAYFLAQQI